MSEVVATRPFDYAGTYRYSGELFELGGHAGDAALLEIGYLVEYESTGDETEDDEGRVFRSERHAELAREHCAQMLAEREAKAEAKNNVEERFNARDASIIAERAVTGTHGSVQGTPRSVAAGFPFLWPKSLRTSKGITNRRAAASPPSTKRHTPPHAIAQCR